MVLRSVGLCVGQNQMCHLCGWLKLFLKKCGGEKNKKHRVGLSVGLLAVQLQYGLYVFGHLSKWFVFGFMFKFWSVCRLVNGRPTIGYNVFQARAVPVVRKVKCTNVQRDAKMQNEQAWILLGVTGSYSVWLFVALYMLSARCPNFVKKSEPFRF